MSIESHYSWVRRDRKGSWVIIQFLMHLKKKEKNLQERVDTQFSRLICLERLLRVCVVLNVTGSNLGLPVNFYQRHLPVLYEIPTLFSPFVLRLKTDRTRK